MLSAREARTWKSDIFPRALFWQCSVFMSFEEHTKLDHSGDHFRLCSVFSVLLGSTVETRALEKREEVCSMKQRQNFKGIKGKVTSICKNISRVFDATCQKFNKKSKSNRLRVEKKLKFECPSLLLKDHTIRICLRQGDLVRPKVHQKFGSCDWSVNTWLFAVATWKPKR